MSGLPWFKCYPEAFLKGMVGLTCEERGAYATVLLLIYERGSPIPDDDAWIASQLWCSARAWRRIRASLIVKGKLREVEAYEQRCLMNDRAGAEISKTAGICAARSEAGKEGGKRSARNRAANFNENNDDAQPIASDLVKQTPSKREADIESIRGSVLSSDNTGEAPVSIEPDQKAWREGVDLLVAGGLKTAEARTFFGGLLKANGIQARDLLGAINEGYANRTQDPKSWLAGAARSRGRKQPVVERRQSFV